MINTWILFVNSLPFDISETWAGEVSLSGGASPYRPLYFIKGVTKSHYGFWSDLPPPSLPSHHTKWEPILLLQISLNQRLKSAVSLILEKSIAGIIEQKQELITNIKIQISRCSPGHWSWARFTGTRGPKQEEGTDHWESRMIFFSFAFSL